MALIDKIMRLVLRKPEAPILRDIFENIELEFYRGNYDEVTNMLENIEIDQIEDDTDFFENYRKIFLARIKVSSGEYKDAQSILEKLSLDHPILKVMHEIETANLNNSQGNYNVGEDHIKNALELVSGFRLVYPFYYKKLLSRALILRSKFIRKKAQFDEAEKELTRAIVILDNLDEKYAKAEPLNDLGITYAQKGQIEKGITNLEESKKLYMELNNNPQLLKIYNNMGLIMQQSGFLEQALENLNNALVISNKLENKPNAAVLKLNIGMIQFELGDIVRSQSNLETSLNELLEFDMVAQASFCMTNLANLHALLGDLTKALDYQNQALEIYSKFDQKVEIAQIKGDMGNIYLQMGNYDKALELFKESYEKFEDIGSSHQSIMFAMNNLISTLLILSRVDEAKSMLEKMETEAEKLGTKRAKNLTLLSKSEVLLSSDRVVQRAEAQKILTTLAYDEADSIHHASTALIKLGGLLLQELRSSPSEEALNEFKDVIFQLDQLIKSENQQPQLTSIMVQVLILKSKLALIDLQMEKSQDLLDEAYELAKSNNFNLLANQISKEQEASKKQLLKYKKMVESNATLLERVNQAQIDDYLVKAASILKR